MTSAGLTGAKRLGHKSAALLQTLHPVHQNFDRLEGNITLPLGWDFPGDGGCGSFDQCTDQQIGIGMAIDNHSEHQYQNAQRVGFFRRRLLDIADQSDKVGECALGHDEG
jgi:hypothetical protein